jgi:S1-C subfamily serine protease
MALDLRDSVVSILKPDRTVAGTGFVVSSDGLVATCAHVVRYAGAEPGGYSGPDLSCYKGDAGGQDRTGVLARSQR